MVQACIQDYRKAEIADSDRAMLDFAAKLTRAPGEMTRQDVKRLREHGFDDSAVFDIVQITALFNYYDRLADGLGVELDAEFADP